VDVGVDDDDVDIDLVLGLVYLNSIWSPGLSRTENIFL
jgi:hypothetical protein